MGMNSSKYGGIERFNVELSQQLATKGYHSVFVYEEVPSAQQFADDIEATGAEVIALNSRRNPIAFCCKLWKLFRRYNFCLIHAHFTKARFYAVPLAHVYGIPDILYTFHSTLYPLTEIKLHTRLWYKLCNRYSRIVTVSRDVEKVAKNNWPSAAIRNLYLGIQSFDEDREQCRMQLGIADNVLMVMCTANFNYVKGLDILVRAAAQLHQTYDLHNVVFYIVGQPDKDREELHKMIDEMELTSYFHLEGISNNIPSYLAAADIYIQPSRNEGIGLALMEACSAGLPILASRVGGIPEVAREGQNAILFKSEDIDEFASALRIMLSDSNIRKQYGECSKQIYVDNFQISNNVSKLIDYYQLN